MSMHIYRSSGSTTVRMGYDRPLNMVFCTVEIDGEMAYSNLADPEAGTDCQAVDYYRVPLTALGIAVPEEMFKGVKMDQAMRIGNKIVEY